MLALLLGASVPATSLHAQEKPADPAAQANEQPEQKPRPTRHKDRVFFKDLEGTWIAAAYRDKLTSTRSPRAAANAAGALAIKIQRDGRSYPLLITNFRRAVLEAIIDIQPDNKPKSYRLAVAKEDATAINAADLSYIYFRGERDAQGTFSTLSIAEPYFSKRRSANYVRLDGALEDFVNQTVIAGKYHDSQGAVYEFTADGEAILPDRKFAYEVSLDPGAARCDVIVSHSEREPEGKERIGFAWKGQLLQLFEVTGTKAPLACGKKPFAELTRQ